MGQTGIRLARVRDEAEELRTHLEEVERNLEGTTPDGSVRDSLETARTMHAGAVQALDRRNLQGAWKKIHRAREALVGAMDDHQLGLEADALLGRCRLLGREKVKLMDLWLGVGVQGETLDERRRTVRRALRLHNEHWDVHYQAARMTESRMRLLSGLLMFATAGAILLAAVDAYRLVPDVPGGTFVGVVVLLGMLGGVVSALVATAASSGSQVLPQTVIDGSWNQLRASFGGASAFLVVLALGGGLLGVTVETQQAYYVWAAVAGFSEGLFVRIATSLTDRLGSSRKVSAPNPNE